MDIENSTRWILINHVFLCVLQVTDADVDDFIEQCQNLISGTYNISCKTGQGVDEMFQDIANILVQSNRSRIELQSLEHHGFKIDPPEPTQEKCKC